MSEYILPGARIGYDARKDISRILATWVQFGAENSLDEKLSEHRVCKSGLDIEALPKPVPEPTSIGISGSFFLGGLTELFSEVWQDTCFFLARLIEGGYRND